jgi:hypothetical protein
MSGNFHVVMAGIAFLTDVFILVKVSIMMENVNVEKSKAG